VITSIRMLLDDEVPPEVVLLSALGELLLLEPQPVSTSSPAATQR